MNKLKEQKSIERIEAGVDWLSATIERSEWSDNHIYPNWCHIVAKIGREGYQVKERSLLGFDGITAGNCFCGGNQERIYLQLSGSYADEYWTRVDREEMHYSRIDVQATVKYKEEQLDIAKECYDEYLVDSTGERRNANRKSYLIVGSDGGDTVYLGAPTSRQRARIYNKARQSEQRALERCWRYEVVFRNELARKWAVSKRSTDLGHDIFCSDTVAQWLYLRGIDCGFYDATKSLVLPKTRIRPTEIEAKLHWLATQVRPTIKYLIEAGYRDTLDDVLGLSDTAKGP